MTRSDVKTYKALLIFSLVFFIGFLMFGIIPYLLNNESMWDQSISLRGIGLIFGISFTISMISYIYLAISSLKPYKTISNYMKIVHAVMLFSLFNYILPDESGYSDNVRIIIFITFGFIIIIPNIVLYLKAKTHSNDNQDTKLNGDFVSEMNPITDEKDGIFLFNLVFFAILMLSLSNQNMNSIEEYSMIVVLNSFILYKFIKTTSSTKEDIKIIIVSAIILCAAAITLLEINPSIFVSKFTDFHIIFSILPSIFIIPKILKNYYTITWNKYYE